VPWIAFIRVFPAAGQLGHDPAKSLLRTILSEDRSVPDGGASAATSDFDRIMAELTGRWKTRMKAIHARSISNNDADSELDKFRWLKLHEVIDEAEFSRIAEQLRTYAAVRARPLPSEGTIN